MSQQFGTATGPAKLKAVTELVNTLSDDLERTALLPVGTSSEPSVQDGGLTEAARDRAFEELKIYGRDPNYADPIFTEKGITMLLRYAFQSPSDKTAHGALRVLANSMLLKGEIRQMFVDKGYAPQACNGLKKESWDDEFLVSRIIFLSTYGTKVNLKELIDDHHLAERVVDNLGRHAKELEKGKTRSEMMQDMALVETLKLLFNVTHFCPDRADRFSPAVPHIVALLWKHDVPDEKPLEPPFGPLVNALLNLNPTDDKSKAALYPKDEPDAVALRLIELLEPAIKTYDDNVLDPLVTPLVSVISKVHEHAPEGTKKAIRELLLPTKEDRENVLGTGDSLSARFLKASTHPTAESMREVISHLLFEMSDKDASKFVENVGYGYASGFLFKNDIPIPASAQEGFNATDTRGSQQSVNPITGQFIDAERPVDEPEMTEEEKEREAERLFVLFERLKKTGIVDVQNPVEAAMREGRFRELKDDEVEELE